MTIGRRWSEWVFRGSTGARNRAQVPGRVRGLFLERLEPRERIGIRDFIVDGFDVNPLRAPDVIKFVGSVRNFRVVDDDAPGSGDDPVRERRVAALAVRAAAIGAAGPYANAEPGRFAGVTLWNDATPMPRQRQSSSGAITGCTAVYQRLWKRGLVGVFGGQSRINAVFGSMIVPTLDLLEAARATQEENP